ncbi:MAG: TetR/AcrR family transcriptional regulator [Acidimicrobiales bacterium]
MVGPTRYAKGEAKRQEILEVALSLIAEQGFRGSTLREIAQAVGLSNAGVLHYFASKEDLFAEVLRPHRVLLDASTADSVRLDDFISTISANADVPGLVQLYVSLSAEATHAEHGAHDFFAARFERVGVMLSDAIAQAIEQGAVRSDIDPERLARLLIAAADGLQTQWLIRGDVDMADHWPTCCRWSPPEASRDGGPRFEDVGIERRLGGHAVLVPASAAVVRQAAGLGVAVTVVVGDAVSQRGRGDVGLPAMLRRNPLRVVSRCRPRRRRASRIVVSIHAT